VNDQFIATFLSFFVFFARPHCIGQMWTNKGSKRVVPRKEVPFEGMNDVP